VYRIVRDRIVLDDLIAAVSGREVGGLATFCGTVRKENAGKSVAAVEYYAYAAMAEKVMQGIGEEIRKGYGAPRVAMVHRVGRLEIGEVSVAIAVGAPHRREAISAVAYAIERLKQVVPVWKKEFYADGSAWLEPTPIVAPVGDKE